MKTWNIFGFMILQSALSLSCSTADTGQKDESQSETSGFTWRGPVLGGIPITPVVNGAANILKTVIDSEKGDIFSSKVIAEALPAGVDGMQLINCITTEEKGSKFYTYLGVEAARVEYKIVAVWGCINSSKRHSGKYLRSVTFVPLKVDTWPGHIIKINMISDPAVNDSQVGGLDFPSVRIHADFYLQTPLTTFQVAGEYRVAGLDGIHAVAAENPNWELN